MKWWSGPLLQVGAVGLGVSGSSPAGVKNLRRRGSGYLDLLQVSPSPPVAVTLGIPSKAARVPGVGVLKQSRCPTCFLHTSYPGDYRTAFVGGYIPTVPTQGLEGRGRRLQGSADPEPVHRRNAYSQPPANLPKKGYLSPQ
jgi:hypothetical protein